MSGYRELREGYFWEKTATGVTGQRVYIEHPDGTDDLPEIGTTELSGDFSNCLCRKLRGGKYWYDRTHGLDREKITASFATVEVNVAGTRIFDEDSRRYDLGGEILSIPNASKGWTWALQGTAVNQPLSLSNVMGTLTIQKKITSDATKATYIALCEERAGTINAAEFEDHRAGSVLFNGIAGGTQYDEEGDKYWLFDLTFTFRIIRAMGGTDYANNPITENDWLYVWNKDVSGSQGGWDKPQLGNNEYLYDTSNFNELL